MMKSTSSLPALGCGAALCTEMTESVPVTGSILIQSTGAPFLARLRASRNERGVEAWRQEKQVVRDPIAFGILVLRRIGSRRLGQPLQRVSLFLERHHGRGAVEHVGLRLARPAFVDDLDRKLGR